MPSPADLIRIAEEMVKASRLGDGDPRQDIPGAESADEFNGHVADKPSGKITFPLVAFENIRLDTDRRGYFVKGLLPDRGLVVIWGPPKCYKSFWATDIGLHIALDWEYRGRRVQQATVVYIALEGRHGFPARIEAFKQHHGVQSAPFHLITKPLDLVRNADALIADIAAQLGAERPGVVFLDTLNRSLVGSESSDEDMAAFIAAAGKIEDRFGCLVCIVHHCGIDGTRPRGHTSLSGAVEVQLAVKKIGDLQAKVTVELAKDIPEGTDIFSKLEMVDLGTDPDGDRVTSLIVLPAEASACQQTAPRKLSDRQRLALDALTECTLNTGKPAPANLGLPASIIVVPIETWRNELFTRSVLARDAKNPRADYQAAARSTSRPQAHRHSRRHHVEGLAAHRSTVACVAPYKGGATLRYGCSRSDGP